MRLDIHKEDDLQTARQYEVVFIIDPAADEAEVSRLTESHKQIVTDQGAVITKAESWGKRPLAYEILHQTEGTFVLFEIEGSGREIAELERRMRVTDAVIRYITIRIDEDLKRAEKFRARRAAHAAASAGSRRGGRRAEPVLPIGEDEEEGAEEEGEL